MNQQEIDEARVKANVAYNSGNFVDALNLSTLLAQHDVPEALLTCGLILENGWAGESDLSKARELYSRLAIKYNAEEGYLGFVRIALAERRQGDAKKCELFCTHVIDRNHDSIAYLLLGRVYEELFGSERFADARSSYLKAGLRGSAWGWRRCARLEYNTGSRALGIILHLVATALSPILILWGGVRASRQG